MRAFQSSFHLRRARGQSKHGEVQLRWTGLAVKQLRRGLAGGLPMPLAAAKPRRGPWPHTAALAPVLLRSYLRRGRGGRCRRLDARGWGRGPGCRRRRGGRKGATLGRGGRPGRGRRCGSGQGIVDALRSPVPLVHPPGAGGVVSNSVQLAVLVVFPLVDPSVEVGVALDAHQLLVLVELPEVSAIVVVGVQLLTHLLAVSVVNGQIVPSVEVEVELLEDRRRSSVVVVVSDVDLAVVIQV